MEKTFYICGADYDESDELSDVDDEMDEKNREKDADSYMLSSEEGDNALNGNKHWGKNGLKEVEELVTTALSEVNIDNV